MIRDVTLRDGWRVVPFREIAHNVTDRVDDPGASGLDHYVGLEHLDPDTLKISRWGSPSDVEATKLRFRPGDVIYARRRAYQRKLGVAEWEGIASAHALVLRARSDVCLPEFLPYFLQSDQFHQRALGISIGSLSPTINWTTLAAQEFALPTPAEQRRIAELMMAADLVAESYALAAHRSELVAHAEVAELLGASRGTVPLGGVADIVGGVTKDAGRKTSSAARAVPYLRVANVLRGSIDLSELATITVEPEVVDKLRLQFGDVLLNEGGDRDKLGRGWIWEGQATDCIHQNHVFRARIRDPRFTPVYVAWMANFGNPQWFERNGRQTTNLASISLRTIARFPLPLLQPVQRSRIDRLIEADLSVRMRVAAAREASKTARRSILEHYLSV